MCKGASVCGNLAGQLVRSSFLHARRLAEVTCSGSRGVPGMESRATRIKRDIGFLPSPLTPRGSAGERGALFGDATLTERVLPGAVVPRTVESGHGWRTQLFVTLARAARTRAFMS